MKIILGYLGPAGTYSHAVRKQLYPKSKYPTLQFQQYLSLSDLMRALENIEIALAIIPVENSKTGLLQDNDGHEFFAKLVTSKSNLYIIAEKFWPLKLLLLGQKGCIIEKVKMIHVNPYTKKQCQAYLSKYLNWQISNHNSSSEAAKVIKESNDPTHAAIASKDAAREYGLEVLDELFKQNEVPIMHFLVLGNDLARAFSHSLEDPVISCFAIKSILLKPFQSYLKSQKLEIILLRKSVDMSDYCFVDINGALTQNQMEFVLDKNLIVKFLGTFVPCPERYLYQNFFIK